MTNINLSIVASNAEELFETLRGLAGGSALVPGTQAAPVKEIKPVTKPASNKAIAAHAQNTPKEEDEETTIEEVRAAVKKQTDAGKRDEVKALLTEYGAGKLSELDPVNFTAFVEKINEL